MAILMNYSGFIVGYRSGVSDVCDVCCDDDGGATIFAIVGVVFVGDLLEQHPIFEGLKFWKY